MPRKYKIVISASTVNEVLLSGQGDSRVGVYGTQSYFRSMPGERNAAFVKAYEARFKRKPTYLSVDAYLAFELLHAAILKANSAEVDAVRSALAGIKLATVVGDDEMRGADHQLLRPLLIVQAVKAGEGKAEMELRAVEPVAKVTTEDPSGWLILPRRSRFWFHIRRYAPDVSLTHFTSALVRSQRAGREP